MPPLDRQAGGADAETRTHAPAPSSIHWREAAACLATAYTAFGVVRALGHAPRIAEGAGGDEALQTGAVAVADHLQTIPNVVSGSVECAVSQ